LDREEFLARIYKKGRIDTHAQTVNACGKLAT